MIPQSRASFLSGIALYRARPGKGYSLTGCVSMQTMRQEGLTKLSPTTAILSRKACEPCSAIFSGS